MLIAVYYCVQVVSLYGCLCSTSEKFGNFFLNVKLLLLKKQSQGKLMKKSFSSIVQHQH